MSVNKAVVLFLIGIFGITFLNAQNLLPLAEVPILELPQQDNKALQIQELEARVPGRPQEFATRINVNVTPETHGIWETTNNGDAVWRMRIRSPKALSLNFGFTQYQMPASGMLYLHSPNGKKAIRPFTDADNESHGQLWTPILPGEETVLEVRLPAARRADLKLELKYVHHDYIGFGAARPPSGSCNLDVICGAADGWGIVDSHRDIIQAAGAYHIGGTATCSGALINNVRNDCTPYYLTADHCGISTSNAPSVVVYWNYQNSFCRQPNSSASGQPGNGTLNQFNTGSIFKAGYTPSDFTLIELDDPLDALHNPYLAGWNRERVVATSAIGIHHPGVEEKRISFENDPLSISGWSQPSDSTHVMVNDWDIGTTEGGSSGSPLFDQNDRIIGQLTGGGAACGNNLEDMFGWLAVSWEGGGTSTSRLKDWLDPDNTGALHMDGKSCAYSVTPSPIVQSVCIPGTGSVTFAIQVSGGFGGNVTLSLNNLPSGANASFSVNPVGPGNSSILTVGNLASLAAGSYTITLLGTDGVESDSTDLVLNVSSAAATTPALTSPSNGQTAVPAVATFTWGASSGTYQIEVATDNQFTNIVSQASGLTSATFSSSLLASLTTYYWHVRASNICGMSAWSPIFSFPPDQINCVNLPA
ncbi:MAG TPA: hypothetical protein ENJ82_04300, partial [Bacteroidetes bacterium]|nr:hypothetical protein [Bacteroidota bacterium]